jgi:hypothetical protein
MSQDRSTKPSSSPDRDTFQKENYLRRCDIEGEEPSQAYLGMWEQARHRDVEWCQQKHENNLEYDLRTSEHMLTQVRSSDNYAQNLYAAMCNRDFQRNDTWPILTDLKWSCSWRHAGGIVADMRESGDYIDWYCSGIGSSEDGYGLSGTVPEVEADGRTYVPEGEVTDEIRADLLKLGWIVLDDSEN